MNNLLKISVLGCGWLGLELAKNLVKNGHMVKGSTTSNHKLTLIERNGIDPYVLELTEDGVNGNLDAFISDSELVIINIPPGLRRNPDKNHFSEIKQLVARIHKHHLQRLFFISSTTVFKDSTEFPEIYNHTIPNGESVSAKQLIAIENYLLNQSAWTTSIIRPGGLFGEDRHPGKQLSGRNQLKNPKAPLNLVHRTDVVNALVAMVETPIPINKLNLVYPYHPEKESYYTNYCKTHKLPLPGFDSSSPSKGKIINSLKTEQLLNLKFRHRP